MSMEKGRSNLQRPKKMNSKTTRTFELAKSEKKLPHIIEIDTTDNFYGVRFRDPKMFIELKNPDWARVVAGSICKDAYITMGKTKHLNWVIQAVKIPKTVNESEVQNLAIKIFKKAEERDINKVMKFAEKGFKAESDAIREYEEWKDSVRSPEFIDDLGEIINDEKDHKKIFKGYKRYLQEE